MDSTRPIRALLRGLDAIAALNSRGSATVSELVTDVRLPRTTVYRVLETLCDAGYVHRDAADDRYRLTPLVRALGDSFDGVAALAQVGAARLATLAASVDLPAGFATLSGTSLRLQERTPAGPEVPVQRVPLSSSVGLAYLASCPAGERDALHAAASRSRAGLPAEAGLAEALARVAAQGYALEAHGAGADAWLAVPVAAGSGALGVLTVRIAAGSPGRADVATRLVTALQACAAAIRDDWVEQRAGACRAGVPATAH